MEKHLNVHLGAVEFLPLLHSIEVQIYLQIIQLLGIVIGYKSYNYCDREDANRLKHARISAAGYQRSSNSPQIAENSAEYQKSEEGRHTI